MSDGELNLQSEFLDEAAFEAALAVAPSPISVFKDYLSRLHKRLNALFIHALDADFLVPARARCLDFLLKQAWRLHIPKADNAFSEDIALVAVGGYGRGELHPHSDIDLLILLKDEPSLDQYREHMQAFITFLWDIKLNIGHSVRTLVECHSEASHDLSIMTNLIERRLISGDKALYKSLAPILNSPNFWSPETFFKAKWEEQTNRHTKYQTHEYNLEPNIKGSPGGLRDLQVIGWVCKRHLGTSSLRVLKESLLLNTEEYQALEHSRRFLWQIRYALHMLADREEDRLLFHFQRQIAEMLGYESNASAIAVEHFMQQFYRAQHEVIELNDLIFIQLRERYSAIRKTPITKPLNEDFHLVDDALAINNPEDIESKPALLLQAFYLMSKNASIQGIRSTTVRVLRNYRHLIDENFRNDPSHAQIFLSLLKNEDNVVRECNRMMRYGILGNYIPEFGRIIGRMQHDLFHVYTFDEHSLRTLRLIRAIRRGEDQQRFPLASRIIQRLPQKSVLYLAALLHDIGKAEEGPHDIKGARLVKRICKRYRLPRRESLLLTWLVRNHLLLSQSAQRENLMDPEVAHRLAIQIRDKLYLDYLYVLSVADIVSTNPSLWTGWRAQQMRQAYSAVAKAIDYGLQSPADPKAWIKDKKQQALTLLSDMGIEAESARRFWATLDASYFWNFRPIR
jgi:[protein-PII] uridylyltransferase